jgi:excinuclease ABC subunit A
MTVVTGVSGSGKSTLVNKTLFSALNKRINGAGERTGRYATLTGDLHRITQVELIDQNPIGKSSSSNPVTYIKAWDEVRKLMADQPLSEMNGYKASHFSFNVDGGRCEECQGEGVIKVEMQFMADVYLTCEHCHGTRFRDEILDVRYAGKNVHDMLEMSVTDSLDFFSSQKDSIPQKRSPRNCNPWPMLVWVMLSWVNHHPPFRAVKASGSSLHPFSPGVTMPDIHCLSLTNPRPACISMISKHS